MCTCVLCVCSPMYCINMFKLYINVCCLPFCVGMLYMCVICAHCMDKFCVQLYIYVNVSVSVTVLQVFCKKWKRKCVIICGEYSLKLNRLKTTFPRLSEKNVEGFSEREENLSGNHIYIFLACFRIKTKNEKKLNKSMPHAPDTESYFEKCWLVAASWCACLWHFKITNCC
jgi:hypothetical protein